MDPRERVGRAADEFVEPDTTTETFERNAAAAQRQLLDFGIQLILWAAMSTADKENAT